jgi:signal transduction histidine kinase
MMLHLELVKQSLEAPDPDVRESLDVIGAEIRRLDRVVQGFLRFVRPQELSPKPVDLGALLQATAALLEAESSKAGVRFVFALDPTCPPVSADEELLRQAFLNLMLNACQAMPSGGAVTIRTEWKRADWVAASITDQGIGIPEADRERIFALYYTTKPDGNGIGLSVVFRIVQMHDGAVDVQSEVGRGTTMTVRLPFRA